MANDPNTYYAKPNEVVDGSKLPSNITNIQGAGGNKINLSGNLFTYYAGSGNDTITGTTSMYTQFFLGNTSNVIANFNTGVIENNGAGGSDIATNITGIWTTNSTKLSTNIFGNSLVNQFYLQSDNNTIDGGGGVDLKLNLEIV